MSHWMFRRSGLIGELENRAKIPAMMLDLKLHDLKLAHCQAPEGSESNVQDIHPDRIACFPV